VQRAAQRGLVAAGGLEDDVDLAPRLRLFGGPEQLEDAGVAPGIVVDGVGGPGEAELERGIGNVDASVQDGGVVLTHTCLMRASGGCIPPSLIQRFEFGAMDAGVDLLRDASRSRERRQGGAYAATNITAAWAASRAAVLFCTLLSQRLQSTNSKIIGVFRE
jgi:hypothetical protein